MFGGQPNASWAIWDDDGVADPMSRKRKSLASALLYGGPNAQRVLGGGARPMFGGLGRGTHSAASLPNAALPALTFNPFMAQLRAGITGLEAPTSVARQNVNDLTGQGTPASAAPGSPAGGPPAGVGGGPPSGLPAPAAPAALPQPPAGAPGSRFLQGTASVDPASTDSFYGNAQQIMPTLYGLRNGPRRAF